MKKSITLSIIATVVTTVSSLSTSMIASADHQQDRDVWGGGSKYYNSAYVRTDWNGHLQSNSHSLSSWESDECKFTGTANTRFTGLRQCDSVTHYDIVEVEGWGQPSFSGGIGASSKGPTGQFGISCASTNKNQTYAYPVSNAWSSYVDYSYYAKIWDYDWMDLYTAGTCLFGNYNVDVNSRVDNPYVYRGPVYYS